MHCPYLSPPCPTSGGFRPGRGPPRNSGKLFYPASKPCGTAHQSAWIAPCSDKRIWGSKKDASSYSTTAKRSCEANGASHERSLRVLKNPNNARTSNTTISTRSPPRNLGDGQRSCCLRAQRGTGGSAVGESPQRSASPICTFWQGRLGRSTCGRSD